MRSRAVVTLVVLAGTLVSGGWFLQRGFENSGSVTNTAALFGAVMKKISEQYIDSINQAQLYQKAVDGMLEELGDPYSVVLTPERLRRLNETTSGRYWGVGIQLDFRDGWITVIARTPGGPAERAGIQAGDRIVEINGRPTEDLLPDEALRALRGRKGTRVSLTIQRAGVEDRLSYTLVRTEIHTRAVRRAAMLGPRLGYVALGIFNDSTTEELRHTVDSLRAGDMSTLVLDLRGNPGGLLEQGVEVSELFLDPGQEIVSLRGRAYGATREFTDKSDQPWPMLGLIVLVNEFTASASEIVAGALQDHDRAAIVGTTTHGKGSAQSVFVLTNGSGLKLTTGRWFTPAGRSIQSAPASDADNSDDFDGDEGESSRPSLSKRARFRTHAGRVVYGGGGITPDVIVGTQDSTRLPLYRAPEGSGNAELVRWLRNDRVIAAAVELSAGARTQWELLKRATERRAAKLEDLPPP